ncbi:hypothetical protein BC939DRAFT_502335 [Gamsiella multidivaricata]|uniref:uncharacterized protein n=1 Tax=Gamsiella multidivaricata TaxID=101098 RepID=UPI00221E8EED|nr:uncharacterized protein BC939DRAFT_502335 [Gamsiella multidivaricata]KAI7825092.1 hypothetical protein BC939DRAFT_502335 [Gamsiella multidivaricata]
MASFPRAKVDSSTQTDPPLPFTALLDRTLDRVEATVPLNLSSITFYIRRHHLSRIEQIEALLSENFFFKAVLFRIGLRPQHIFSFLCLLTLYGCRQLYRRSVYLTTNLCAVAYPAYCSIKTINSEPIAPPRGLGLEPTEYGPLYSARRPNSTYSSSGSIRSGRQRSRRQRNRMSNSMNEDSMQSSNSYSSSQEDFDDSRRSEASSWGRPSDYSNYSEDNITSTSYSGSMTVEEKMKQRMRRRWAKFSQTRKDKATRQWLAYWSIYGTVQVIDTWSSFLLDWIPGYNLGKLLFLWWAQRRGATLVFDYFQPLIQSKNKDGREVARKPSNRSLNSEMSRHERGGSSGGPSGSRPTSIQMLPSALAQQHQQQHQQYQQQQPQYQQQQFEQQFYGKGGASRRDTATFRDLNQGRRRREDYYEDEEDENDFHDHRNYQQQFIRDQQKQHQQPLDLRRELMNSSPHDSGAFAETPLFESAESVWSAPPISTSMLAVDDIGGMTRMATHSNNATPTPMSVQEQYLRLHQVHQQQQQAQKSLQPLSQDANSYAVASTIHWNPSTSTSATSTD